MQIPAEFKPREYPKFVGDPVANYPALVGRPTVWIEARQITHNGTTQNAVEWARQYGIPVSTLNYRISRGWPMSRVLASKETN